MFGGSFCHFWASYLIPPSIILSSPPPLSDTLSPLGISQQGLRGTERRRFELCVSPSVSLFLHRAVRASHSHAAHASPFDGASAPPLPHRYTHSVNGIRRWGLRRLKQKILVLKLVRKCEWGQIKRVCVTGWIMHHHVWFMHEYAFVLRYAYQLSAVQEQRVNSGSVIYWIELNHQHGFEIQVLSVVNAS